MPSCGAALLAVFAALSPLGAQGGTGDPTADRYLLLTTARTLPRDTTHVAVMATLTTGVVGYGALERLTLTVGSPAWTVFTGLAILGWNAKVGLIERPRLAVAVGDVGLVVAAFGAARTGNEEVEAVHWPYVSVTAAAGRLEATGNVGLGRGGTSEVTLLGRTVLQGGVAFLAGDRLRLFLEYSEVGYDRGVTAFGIRVWDDRYFLDMGGITNVWQPRVLPWFSIGGRL